jgi:hypothetical protein
MYTMIKEEQRRVDRWIDFLKTFFMYFVCFVASALSLLLVAVTIYACVYYLFVPKIEHSFPVYMDYGDTTLISGEKHNGPPVVAQVPLTTYHTQYTKTKLAVSDYKGEQLLVAGQGYTVILEIVAPESPKNINLGPVMVETKLYGKRISQNDLLAVSRRPVLLNYRSSYVKYLQNFIYSGPLAFGFFKETQRLSIFAFDHFVESSTHRTLNAEILFHNHNFEVYDVKLKIVAELKGLQYFMYYWFLPSFIIGVGNIFFFEACSICLFGIIYLLYFNNGGINDNKYSNDRKNSSYSYTSDNLMFDQLTPLKTSKNNTYENSEPKKVVENTEDVRDIVEEVSDNVIFSDKGIRKFQKGLKLPNLKQSKEALATEFFNKIIEEDKDLSQVKLKMKQSSRTAEEILEEQRRLKVKKQQLKNKKSLSISNIGMVDQEL